MQTKISNTPGVNKAMTRSRKYQIAAGVASMFICAVPFIMSYLLRWNLKYLGIGFIGLILALALAYSFKTPKFRTIACFATLATALLFIAYAIMFEPKEYSMGAGTTIFLLNFWGVAYKFQMEETESESVNIDE